jgi:NADH-quinone oxidoreductase subunit M
MFLLTSLSSIAVPGTNGFVGEFLILMGAWSFSPTLVAVASLGVILAAAYVLWMVKRVFYGELTNAKNQGLPTCRRARPRVLLPLVALTIVMGVMSPVFTRRIEPSPTRGAPGPRAHAAGSRRSDGIGCASAGTDAGRGVGR